nr:polysaccharide biosynthesis tyrosine autokinase [Ancylobacter crimeensis]
MFRVWRILSRRRRQIGIVVLLCLLVGLLVTFMMQPVYRGTVTIQIARESSKIVNVESVDPDDDGGGSGGSREYLETQYQLLKSRALAEKVVQATNLDSPSSTALNNSGGGFFSWVKSNVSALLSSDPAPTQQGPDLAARRNQAIGLVLGMIDVQPQRNSQLVSVNVSSPDPQMAARLANALAESYIAQSLERRYNASSYARSFLQDRLAELKLKVEESEKDLVNYAQSQGIVNMDNDSTLLSADLETANSSLGTARGQRIRDEEMWKIAENTPPLSIPEVIQDSSVRALRDQIAAASAEYQQKLSQFKPAFPQMVELKAKMDELQFQLDAQSNLIKETIKARYEASLQQEKVLQAQLDAVKQDALGMRDRLIRYNILKREVESNKSLYDGLLQRYKEVGIAGGIGASNISIVDRAQVPGAPYSPNMILNLGLAGFVGLILGIGLAFGLEMLDDTLKSPDHAEEKIGVPVVGVIPLGGGDADLLTQMETPKSNLAEAFRSLRTSLQVSTPEGVPKSLLITSSQPGEGKSTTAVALAQNFAQLGYRVLLIDADLRRPSLHRVLDVPNEVGIVDYLSGAVPLASIVQSYGPNLTLIPCGAPPRDPTELLAGTRMKALIDYSSKHFDLLLLDGPPILELADAPLLASMTEGTLLVVSANTVRHSVVRTRIKRLQRARATITGVVLNRFDMRAADSYYYYSGYYSGAYDYGTSDETPADGSLTNPQGDGPDDGTAASPAGTETPVVADNRAGSDRRDDGSGRGA